MAYSQVFEKIPILFMGKSKQKIEIKDIKLLYSDLLIL